MPSGLFGQTVFDPATGTKQGEMFDTSKPIPKSAPIKGSKNALDPKHTGNLFDGNKTMPTAEGHWITTKEGNHVLIKDPIGGGKGFNRAAIQRKLVEHHNAVTGGGSYTAADERDLHAAAGSGDPFTFHKSLPTEIKEFQAGRPELRSLFKVTQDAGKAGGADAFGEMGDRYLDIAERHAGSPVRQALNTARGSDDPEVRFMAAIHDHLPVGAERSAMGSIEAGKLRVGQSFKIQGDEFHVIEDADGFKVLSGPHDYGETPVDGLKKIPIDRGSFRAAKAAKFRADSAAPFSDDPDDHPDGIVLDDDGEWRTINGAKVLIKDGKITEGPDHLKGKPAEVHEKGSLPHDHPDVIEWQRKGFEKMSTPKLKSAYQSHMMFNGKSTDASAIQRKSLMEAELSKRGVKIVKGEFSDELNGDDDAFGLVLGDVPLDDFTAALTLGDNFAWPKVKNGKPCSYYWKESLPVDRDFYDAKGRRWRFTGEDIDAAIDTLRLAGSKGFQPSTPADHKLTGRNYGYIVDARRNAKGNLELLHQFIGKDEASEALNKKSSICILPNVRASDGTVYRNLIHHNAVLPHPQIHDLEDFQPAFDQPALAASGQAVRAVVLTLAAPTTLQEASMPDLSKIRKLVGAAQNATDEQVLTTAETQLGELATAKADALKLASDLKGVRLELSSLAPEKPTARELRYARKAVDDARKRALESGAIDTKTADRAEKRFSRKAVDSDALTLSREVEDDDHLILSSFDTLIEFFETVEGNKPASPTGQKTGSQGTRPVLMLGSGDADEDNKDAVEAGKTAGEAWKKNQLAQRGIASA